MSSLGFDDALWPAVTRFVPETLLSAIEEAAPLADTAGKMDPGVLDQLKAAGYFGAPVPPELQGSGATLLECAAVQRRLAASDGGLAIGLNMHLFSVGMMVHLWRRRRDLTWVMLEAIASQRRMVASAFAEPGLAGNVLRSRCIGVRVDGGFVVSGVKTPCSIASRSDLISFQFEFEREPGGRRELGLAMVPTKAAGIEVGGAWDSLGMRSSESATVRLEKCFVPDQLVFHQCPPRTVDPVFSVGLVWFCVTTAATYSGVCRRVLAEARRQLKGAATVPGATSRAQLPSFKSALGDCFGHLLAVEAACVALSRAFDDGSCEPAALLAHALSLKQAALEVCPRLVEECIELCGGRAYERTGVMARLWRDVQGLRFHPPARLMTREMLGRAVLEEQLDLDFLGGA